MSRIGNYPKPHLSIWIDLKNRFKSKRLKRLEKENEHLISIAVNYKQLIDGITIENGKIELSENATMLVVTDKLRKDFEYKIHKIMHG